MEPDLDSVFDLLRGNRHCYLATSTLVGEPWVTPLRFEYDERCRIVWESARTAHHSELLRRNPRVAIVIPDTEARAGVYLEAIAMEVPPERLAQALALFKKGRGEESEAADRGVDDYRGDKVLRLYEATPLRLYGLVQTRTPDGYEIDERVPIGLPR
jgi:hypothetical protein